MRVDSRELPLSAIPLCQLLPCHFGPPRPTLSINLYVKGCLDCTIGAFHMSIPSVFSPSEWGPDPQCQAAQVAHWTWWWQCLAAWHCRSVWSLPCHFAADAGGSALSMAKSHWHGALRSAHKSCTHGHVFWKRGGMKRELVADPWTSSRLFSHVLWLRAHSHLLLRACLLGSKRKLPPQEATTSEEGKNRFSRWPPSWISDWNNFSYFYIYKSSRHFLPIFKSTGPLVQDNKHRSTSHPNAS